MPDAPCADARRRGCTDGAAVPDPELALEWVDG